MKLTGKNMPVNLTNCFLAWRPDINQPFIYDIEGTKTILVFTKVEKLDFFLKGLDYKIKKIDNGIEFRNSVKNHYMISLDPYITPEGNVRFYCVTSSEEIN